MAQVSKILLLGQEQRSLLRKHAIGYGATTDKGVKALESEVYGNQPGHEANSHVEREFGKETNAYAIIVSTGRGHFVGLLLEDCAQGSLQQCFLQVRYDRL